MSSLFNNSFLRVGHVAIMSLRQASIKLHTKGPLQQHTGAAAVQVPNSGLDKLQPSIRQYIDEKVALCQPDNVHVCDGSEAENEMLLALLEREGTLKRLTKHESCWLAITDPRDVARVERRTVISTPSERDTIPIMKEGVECRTGHWMSPSQLEAAFAERFPGCMKGRTMYVIPFCMGPVGSPLAKYGIELTDSAYVVTNMRIMTRMGAHVLNALGDGEFVKCLHSVGQPLPMKTPPVNNWPCNPEKTIIAHIPDRKEICSYGSGYGGNSLLGKKCFALRIASRLARDEGWLAEHMLILGLTNPEGVKRYVVAAFPSACGKTNLAMLEPTLPGWKAECIGDDIAWMRFDESGRLRAINPEYGFFGVAPGTSYKTNPNAMMSIQKNTIFTNVGETSDGSFYWEGMEDELPEGVSVRSYQGVEHCNDLSRFDGKKPLAAHPNSRFCAPANQCPVMDPAWEDPEGVPIDAIIFGGRRPQGVPLVYESFDWQHGVFVGAAMRSEATAAAEFKKKVVMHDPFAMRPFFGYNIGHYIQHWLQFRQHTEYVLPKIFHVNWFRKSPQGKFLWPGFGENTRVLDWIFRRCDNEDIAKESAIGLLPKEGSINLEGLKEKVDMEALFHLPKDFWEKEVEEIEAYFEEQINEDLPAGIRTELKNLKERISRM